MLRTAEFWVFIAFVAFFLILAYYKVPALIAKALDERAAGIRKELDEARRLREEAQALLADYQRKHRNAGQEAEAIVEQARREAEAYAAETRKSLAETVERRRKQAEDKIARAEAQAVEDVRAAAVDMAIAAAEKILREKAAGASGAALIDDSIRSIKTRFELRRGVGCSRASARSHRSHHRLREIASQGGRLMNAVEPMKRSTARFLTTHTGSLPRPPDLVRMMYAKEEGVPVERVGLAARVRAAVAEVVEKQVEVGIDLVNDGEMSKPSYATYIKDRLDGFGGTGNTFVYQDLAAFPKLAQRVFGDPGRSRRKTPACNAPIAVRDAGDASGDAEADVANLKAAIGSRSPAEAFMSAASPGVVSLFFRNDYYKDHETYLAAIAEAMRAEYEAVAAAGFVLQIDCPDLAMGRHIQYADLSLEEFRKRARQHVEALNHALRNIPPEQLRMHLCWGNYEGPHHCDVALADIVDIVLMAKPQAISLEAANPRHAHEWALFETVKLPEGKVLIPGVIESKSNFIEHPELIAQRIGRYANLVGRENVIAGSDCGYGTWVGQAAVDPDVVWAKLATLAEGARIATREFWR